MHVYVWQQLTIISTFYICHLVYLLKFTLILKSLLMDLYGHLQTYTRVKTDSLDLHVLILTLTLLSVLPIVSVVSSFLICFLLVISVFKIAPRHSEV